MGMDFNRGGVFRLLQGGCGVLFSLSAALAAAQDQADIQGARQEFAPFVQRVEVAPLNSGAPPIFQRLPPVPNAFQPWWHDPIRNKLITDFQDTPVSLEQLLLEAMSHSVQIQAYSQDPLIEETRIDEAVAEFDWISFIESKWTDTNEPVGNTLTVGGGRTRSLAKNSISDVGIKRNNTLGGEFSAAQQFGFQNTNSTFFVPNDQSSSRFTLSYTQPILRGAGKTYNRSQIVIAQTNTAGAHERYLENLQLHLMDVTKAYWDLYLSRGVLLQKQKLYDSANQIVEKMQKRADLDATNDQLIRAKAAATKRYTELLRAQYDVAGKQDAIRRVVNSPALEAEFQLEFIPQDSPLTAPLDLNLQQALMTAFDNRPEIQASLKDIKAAAVQKYVAEVDLLPQLDVVLNTYVAGLAGEYDVGRSFNQQFTDGRPSYSIGLNYEMPLGNRAAAARDRRQALEIARLQAQFRVVVERVTLEVRNAVRDLDLQSKELAARYEALQSAKDEVVFIENRLRLLPSMNRTASLYLENLLTSQERLTQAEFEFLQTQIAYSMAIVKLKQVTGTLLQYDPPAIPPAATGTIDEVLKTETPTDGAVVPPPVDLVPIEDEMDEAPPTTVRTPTFPKESDEGSDEEQVIPLTPLSPLSPPSELEGIPLEPQFDEAPVGSGLPGNSTTTLPLQPIDEDDSGPFELPKLPNTPGSEPSSQPPSQLVPQPLEKAPPPPKIVPPSDFDTQTWKAPATPVATK